MVPILEGAIVMGFAAAGLFFLRFWRETRDRLFLLFGLAFFVLAANRVGLAQAAQQAADRDVLYWVRFLAYALILVAIVDKNRPRKPKDADRATPGRQP